MLNQEYDMMEVLHNGKVERRQFHIEVEADSMKLGLGYNPIPPRRVPHTEPNEQVCYFISGQMPQIVDIKWPDPHDCYTLAPAYLKPQGDA